MKLNKLSYIFFVSIIIIACKARSYETSKETTNTSIVEIDTVKKDIKIPVVIGVSTYTADSTIEVIKLTKDSIRVIAHAKKIVNTITTNETFANKRVELKKLRVKKDSVDKAAKVTIATVKAKVKELRIAAHKDKPGFFGNMVLIVKQIKWILLLVFILTMIGLNLKYKKWLP